MNDYLKLEAWLRAQRRRHLYNMSSTSGDMGTLCGKGCQWFTAAQISSR